MTFKAPFKSQYYWLVGLDLKHKKFYAFEVETACCRPTGKVIDPENVNKDSQVLRLTSKIYDYPLRKEQAERIVNKLNFRGPDLVKISMEGV